MNDLPELLDHVPPLMLVMFRIGGLMIFGPVFGSPVIPTRVKVLLTAMIALAVYPLMASHLSLADGMELNLWLLGPIIALELLVGLAIGYLASLPLVSIQMGGLMMGQQMGLGFARFYNPGIDDEADVIGQILFFLALAGFLLMGGHEAMMLGVLRSFEYVPLGGMRPDGQLVDLITGLLLAAFDLSLRVAAPVLALVFLESLAMGFVAKTVPQLNILSLGFPIRILAGILILMLGLVVIHEVVMEGVADGLELIHAWVESRGEVP
jgi:flagellar biosynthetic protein FliR